MHVGVGSTPAVDTYMDGVRETFERTNAWGAAYMAKAQDPLARQYVEMTPQEVASRQMEGLIDMCLPYLEDEFRDMSEAAVYVRVVRAHIPQLAFAEYLSDEVIVLVVDADLQYLTSHIATFVPVLLQRHGREDCPELETVMRMLRAEIGCLRWLGFPLILCHVPLTDDEESLLHRYLSLTAMQFILLHELGHVFLHRKNRHALSPIVREGEADEFAGRMALRIARRNGHSEEIVSVYGPMGIDVALGVLALLEQVIYIVPPQTHPPAYDRRAAVMRSLNIEARRQPHVGTVIEVFFKNLTDRLFTPFPKLSTLLTTENAILLDLADFDDEGVVEVLGMFDFIDVLECFLRGDAFASYSLLSHQPVFDTSAAALDLGLVAPIKTMVADFELVDLSVVDWINCAIGVLILERLLKFQSDDELLDTTHPKAGTKFVDWAPWIERYYLSPDVRRVVLPAIKAYATDTVIVPALKASGVLNRIDTRLREIVPAGAAPLCLKFLDADWRPSNKLEESLADLRVKARWFSNLLQ